jgi:hypothetical protein
VSTIEERLSRDIEAVTGGIVVTESDLRDARAEVNERIENGQQHSRRRGVVAAAAAAAVVVGVATWQGLSGDDPSPSPAPPGPSPSELTDAEQEFLTGEPVTAGVLPGVWRLDNGSTLFMFSSDGRFSLDDTGQLSADPLVDGTYEVENDAISVDIEGGTAGCAGKAITLRAVVTEAGTLNVLPVGRGASGCEAPSSYQWVLEPALPAGFFSEIKNGPGANWSPPLGYEAVQATWYDPQGGYLVELRDDGTFTTLAGMGEVADRGTWTVDPEVTRLSIVSGADSPTCREGDRFVLDNLRAREIGVLNLEGDLARNDCDVEWKGTAWVRLAP